MLHLSDIERKLLQKVAIAKLQALNLGVNVKVPTGEQLKKFFRLEINTVYLQKMWRRWQNRKGDHICSKGKPLPLEYLTQVERMPKKRKVIGYKWTNLLNRSNENWLQKDAKALLLLVNAFRYKLLNKLYKIRKTL